MAIQDTTIPPRNDLQALGGYDQIQNRLQQGQSFTDPAGNTGIVNFDTKSGEKLNPGEFTYALPSNLNTANAADVGNGTEITTPVLSPYSSAGSSAEAVGAITDANKNSLTEEDKKAQAELDALKTEQQTGKTAIQTIFDRLRGVNKEKNTLYQESGVNTARKQVDEIANQIEAEQLAARRRIEDARKNFTGTTAGLQAEEARINRESFSKLADMSIVQNAALRNYSTIKDIADRQIDAETEDLKLELDGLKFFYSENKDELTKKEDQAYQEKIKTADRIYNETRETKKTLSDTKLELLKSASEQSAPVSILQAIQNAKTPEEALIAAGQYSGDVLDRQYKLAQINKLRSDAVKSKNSESASKYKIQAGDSLFIIAQKKGILLEALQAANPAVDVNNLRPGQIINIPTSSDSTPTSVDLKQTINKAISASGADFENASDEEKKAYIRSLGGNPSDFGY